MFTIEGSLPQLITDPIIICYYPPVRASIVMQPIKVFNLVPRVRLLMLRAPIVLGHCKLVGWRIDVISLLVNLRLPWNFLWVCRRF